MLGYFFRRPRRDDASAAGAALRTQIDPAKTNAVVDGRWLQRKRDLIAGVKADSDTRDGAAKCSLCVH